jgi:hypothetical protein
MRFRFFLLRGMTTMSFEEALAAASRDEGFEGRMGRQGTEAQGDYSAAP